MDDHPEIVVDSAQSRRTLWAEELSLFAGLRLLPAVQRIVGRPLRLVYTFSIAYDTGGDLKPHRDRPQNAFSLSLNLGLLRDPQSQSQLQPKRGGQPQPGEEAGQEAADEGGDWEEEGGDGEDGGAGGLSASPTPWPLWVVPVGRTEAEAVAARLRENDALLYQGPLNTHFRERLDEGASMQVIFGFRDISETHCSSQ